MKLTQTILLALTAFKLAQALPQNNNFRGGNNNDQNDNNQDQNDNQDQGNNDQFQNGNAGNGTDTGAGNGGNTGAGADAGDTGAGAGGGNAGGNTCLDTANIQDASASQGAPDPAKGQSNSLQYVLANSLSITV